MREQLENTTSLSNSKDSEFETYSISSAISITPFPALSIDAKYSSNKTNGQKGENRLDIVFSPKITSVSNISFDYSRTQNTGTGFNVIQQENANQGTGDFIETSIILRNDVVQRGSVSISSTYPIENPYVQTFVIEAEGYLKRVEDKKNSNSNYDISGLV